MILTKEQLEVLNSEGHLLATGGPGSGKTTISILKAAQFVERGLRSGQRILFLSFARSTVARVVGAIENEKSLTPRQKLCIDVETYHSYFWRIIKSHGYLTGLPRVLNILTPTNEAVALSKFRSKKVNQPDINNEEEIERLRLATLEGKICFDLFETYAKTILSGSERIRRLLSTMYPMIILDEFQDTNEQQWHVVQQLGKHSQLIALADPEQRIYQWKGAHPERINHFREVFNPTVITLNDTNHRSVGTEILLFGNDILTGRFTKSEYRGIFIKQFKPIPNIALTMLVTETYAARKRLTDQRLNAWSVAILVPTKKLTRIVSDSFNKPPATLTEIPHSAAIDMEGAILSAEVIAFLLQPDIDGLHFKILIDLVCNYYLGKGGIKPTSRAMSEAIRIRKEYGKLTEGYSFNGSNLFQKTIDVYNKSRALKFQGDPEKDWLMVRQTLEEGPCKRFREISCDAKSVRLLNRGTELRQALSRDWRENGQYTNALSIIQNAFVRDHFSTSAQPETGVLVMNMHKAKGKQFDEVIIFEGVPSKNQNRIVLSNTTTNINDQTRQNLRVSITRAKQRVTILTPNNDPCLLLPVQI